MPDVYDQTQRSKVMRSVKSENTKPEVIVRQMLHALGYRFRLHRQDLPGAPDIVLPRHRKIVLVHGCFWHCHSRCPKATRPENNGQFWAEKLDGNARRDREHCRRLRQFGWRVLVVWECEIPRTDELC